MGDKGPEMLNTQLVPAPISHEIAADQLLNKLF